MNKYSEYKEAYKQLIKEAISSSGVSGKVIDTVYDAAKKSYRKPNSFEGFKASIKNKLNELKGSTAGQAFNNWTDGLQTMTPDEKVFMAAAGAMGLTAPIITGVGMEFGRSTTLPFASFQWDNVGDNIKNMYSSPGMIPAVALPLLAASLVPAQRAGIKDSLYETVYKMGRSHKASKAAANKDKLVKKMWDEIFELNKNRFIENKTNG